jgi:hypothetical protein
MVVVGVDIIGDEQEMAVEAAGGRRRRVRRHRRHRTGTGGLRRG